MPSLTLKPSHRAVAAYHESLAAFRTLGQEHEQAVRSAFATLPEAAVPAKTACTSRRLDHLVKC